jgi:hypothetical protein
MEPEALAHVFRDHCKTEKPELFPLLPQRHRYMIPEIERIIERREQATKPDTVKTKAAKTNKSR